MNFPKPRRIDITTIAQAVDAGCDCVMLKHDGWPVLINCLGDEATVLSALDVSTQERIDKLVPREALTALFVGAKSITNPVIYLYDTWWMNGQDVQKLTYRERYALTRLNYKKLDERFQMVTVYPIQAAKALWDDCVRGGYKGLVFRRSRDTSAGELYTIPHYAEMPRELV